MKRVQHETMMDECLRLARKGIGKVSPNPLVGAVLVKGGRIIGRGYHRAFGGPHAEVECIRAAISSPRGATLYVNLEPCCHHGKTTPCTDLILGSGIKRVVVGMKDPNPLVAGKGVARLRRNGVDVVSGVRQSEAETLNDIFSTHITKKRPYVHIKLAQSLDGKIAPLSRRRVQLSSLPSLKMVHQWRAEHDAVLVGAATVASDNPRLNVRYVRGRNPVIVVVSGRFSAPLHATLWKYAATRKVIVLTTRSAVRRSPQKAARLTSLGVEMIVCESQGMSISPSIILKELYRRNIGSLLLEGGARLASRFIHEGCVDRLSLFVTPKVMVTGIPAFPHMQGPPGKRMRVKGFSHTQVGPDVLLSARFS